MANVDKFKIGTRFVGNVNKAEMEIVDIKKDVLGTESGRLTETNQVVVVKDLKSGKLFEYGPEALEMCDVTIITD